VVRLDRELTAERARPRETKVVEREVPKIKEVPLPVEKIVNVPVEKEVPVEKVVQVPVEKEKIVQVPVDRLVEVPIERLIEVPIEKVVFVDKQPQQQQPRISAQLGPNVGVGLSLQRSSRVRNPFPSPAAFTNTAWHAPRSFPAAWDRDH
jgi:hypothetical protein